jgi:recombinational DNA repair protein RecT
LKGKEDRAHTKTDTLMYKLNLLFSSRNANRIKSVFSVAAFINIKTRVKCMTEHACEYIKHAWSSSESVNRL